MIRLSFGILCLLICAPVAAGAQSAPAQPAPTIQANANLVVVDVVATDAEHHPVRNLAQTDFTVLENGQPQTIKNFEAHSAAESNAPLPALPKLPAGVFTNLTNAPATGALNVLLLDTLNTPMTDQAAVRAEMLAYLKEAHPGTRMAVFGLTTRLILLEGFTTDPEVLRAALNAKKAVPKGSVAMTDAVNGDNAGAEDPIMDTEEEMIRGILGNDPTADEILANLQQFEAEVQTNQTLLRARVTLDALNVLARYLGGLPGRKNLIWFSGSFPINILPDPDLESPPDIAGVAAKRTQTNMNLGDPFSVVGSAADEFRETTELLARSQVAVYPIDARGTMTAPMLDASNSSQSYVGSPGSFARDSVKFFQQTSDEQGTMKLMAQATGGEAFANTNDLKSAVAKAIAAGSNYYTLTYTPTDEEWKGDFRKIKVEVARPGVTLVYRRGYYADDPNRPLRRNEPAIASAGQPPAYSAIRAAMVRGGPDPTEITFAASVRPSEAQTETAAAPGNQVAEKTQGPFQRYTVVMSVDAHNLDCPAKPDGARTCSLDGVILVYDADGALLNSAVGAIRAEVPADRYQALLKNGLRFKQEISVPTNGETFLRIGVHDLTSNRVGAVELPVSAVSKLPPIASTGQK